MCMWPILSCRNYKFWMQFFKRDIPIYFLSRNIYIFRRKKWQMDSSSMQQEHFFGGKNACVEWQRKRREGGDDKYLPSVRDINLLSSPLSGAAVQISISEGGLTRKEKKKVFSCRKSNTKTADGFPKLYHRKVNLVKRPTNYTHLGKKRNSTTDCLFSPTISEQKSVLSTFFFPLFLLIRKGKKFLSPFSPSPTNHTDLCPIQPWGRGRGRFPPPISTLFLPYPL